MTLRRLIEISHFIWLFCWVFFSLQPMNSWNHHVCTFKKFHHWLPAEQFYRHRMSQAAVVVWAAVYRPFFHHKISQLKLMSTHGHCHQCMAGFILNQPQSSHPQFSLTNLIWALDSLLSYQTDQRHGNPSMVSLKLVRFYFVCCRRAENRMKKKTKQKNKNE